MTTDMRQIRTFTPAQPGQRAQTRHAADAGRQAAKLKDMQAALENTCRHHPVVLEEQAHRGQDVQLRIADWITAFAGSMTFVYLHIALFTVWMLFIESKPWPTLTLIVSLEAIFLDRARMWLMGGLGRLLLSC